MCIRDRCTLGAGASSFLPMNVFPMIASFLPAKLAGDLSFLLIFVGGSLALAFALGRTRLMSVVVFSYVALALVDVIPSSVSSALPEGRAVLFLSLIHI